MNGKSPIKPQPWAVGAAWALIVALMLSALPGPAWAQYPQASLNAGLKAYQSGELVNAYKLLKRALVEAQTDQDRATASLYLGMLYLAWDQKKLAAESIAQAAALDPSRRLNEVEYPPEVIAMFTQARPPGLGAIAIRATPPGAMVALDGDAAVPADGAILRAAPGNHKLSFSKEGYVSQERQVTLEEYGQTNISISLVKILEPLAIRHLPEAFVYEGRPATISAEVTGGHLPLRAVLFFRAGPGETYQQVEMIRQKGNSYTAEASHKAKAGGLLEYYITAMDSVGGVVSAGGERRPLIIKAIPKDSVPPLISHTQAAKVSDDDTLEIHAFITDDSPLSSVRIYFKQAGGGEYSGHEMDPWSAPGNYTFTIPGQLLEGEEIYYYLVAEDVVGNFRSLGDAAAPFVTRPTHDKPRKEAQVAQRESAAGKPGKRVTVNAGALRGYAKGDTLFAINFEEKPQNGASAAQELAGEILVTSVEPASLQGEVVREYYRGAVRPGTAVRLRPSPPRGVGAKSESFEKAQIQWRQSPEPEVRGYLVHRSDKLDGQYRVIAKLEGRGVESYLDSGEAGARLQGGMRYFYRLKSFNSSGALSDMSVTASTVILGGPKPPEGILGHSGLIRKNRLTWIPNTDPDTEGYRIYRSQAEAGAYSLIDELPDPRAGEYLDSARPEDGHPFEEGAVYWYKVLAYDKRGRVGEMSAAASASSMPKPPAPSNLRLESAGDGAFTLAWDLSQLPDVAGYRLYRSASKDGVFEMVAQVDGGATAHYTDAGTRESKLRSDIDYYYKLTLFNHAGAESDMSAAVVASSDKPLAPPSHLQATVGLEGRIIVSWEPSRDPSVDGYVIYRGVTPKEAERIQALPGRETRSFQDYGGEGATLPPGTVYYYSVRPATSEGMEGESAEWARGATKTLLSAVEDLKAQLKKSGEVSLGWTAPQNGEASGYRIFRSTGGGQFLELAVCAENYFTDPSPGPEPAGAEYKVQAIDMDGVAGALSGVAAVSPKPAPSAPTGLQASPGRSSVALSWDPHPDREVAGYNLFLAREGAMVKIATTKNTAWLAEDLTPDTEYQFAVSAVDNENVEGASCPPVKARTLP